MTEQAKEARRQYKRQWYAANKEKQKEYAERHWQKKAALAAAQKDEPTQEE